MDLLEQELKERDEEWNEYENSTGMYPRRFILEMSYPYEWEPMAQCLYDEIRDHISCMRLDSLSEVGSKITQSL